MSLSHAIARNRGQAAKLKIEKNKGTRRVKPIFRWVGGKQYLIRQLLALLPKTPFDRYVEPFLGAASLFLAIRPAHALLADANPHLVSTYQFIRKDPDAVARYLRPLIQKDSAKNYYLVREAYNSARRSAAKAAQFIYLNRTCFNGIFRVNQNGAFNVPYGFKKQPLFPTRDDLEALAEVFNGAELVHASYSEALKTARKGDFVYLDPPYPALNGTSYFVHYTMDRFPAAEQEVLASLFRVLHKRGCLVMLSNADTSKIRKLYAGFNFRRLSATRYVTCKATKHRVKELVITNYS